MSNIKIEESDFLGKSAVMNFIEGEFRFTKTAISSKESVIPAHEIKSLNRAQTSKIGGTNTNVFKGNYIGASFIATIMGLLGFAASGKKLNRSIMVHFKDGTFLRGITDLDTFFEVQNAWLDSKDDVEIN